MGSWGIRVPDMQIHISQQKNDKTGGIYYKTSLSILEKSGNK